MADDIFDVVVVGGGPAGAMAAAAAAGRGARTLLLERDAHIGTPVRCGEGIGLSNLTDLVPIEERWIAKRVEGMIMYSPDETAVPVYAKNELGAILERALFDRYLGERAAESGALIQTRSEVDGLIIPNRRVEGVTYSRLGRQRRVRAGMVVAADGVDSRVGRWAGINTQLATCDLESAYQKIIGGIDYDSRFCHFYFGDEVAPGGYLWIFPKSDRVASVGIGVEVRRCAAGEAYHKLDKFIRSHFGNPAVIGEMAGGVPVSRPLRDPARSGILLAGDAARHCNPITGGGIYTAMVSGRHAGCVAAEAVSRGDVSASFLLREFLNRIDEPITKAHKRAYRLSEAVGKISDEAMNQTARDIMAIPTEQRSLRNIILRGLKNNPGLVVDIVKAFV